MDNRFWTIVIVWENFNLWRFGHTLVAFRQLLPATCYHDNSRSMLDILFKVWTRECQLPSQRDCWLPSQRECWLPSQRGCWLPSQRGCWLPSQREYASFHLRENASYVWTVKWDIFVYILFMVWVLHATPHEVTMNNIITWPHIKHRMILCYLCDLWPSHGGSLLSTMVTGFILPHSWWSSYWTEGQWLLDLTNCLQLFTVRKKLCFNLILRHLCMRLVDSNSQCSFHC